MASLHTELAEARAELTTVMVEMEAARVDLAGLGSPRQGESPSNGAAQSGRRPNTLRRWCCPLRSCQRPIVDRTTTSRYDRRRFRLTRLTISIKMILLANQK
jgi:hypothetical protein